jgi:hypothetical protein
VGDVLKVVAILNWLDGEVVQNVFSAVIGGSGPYDDADIVDDAVDWADTMYDNLITDLNDDIDGSEVRVYVYDPVDDDFDEVGTGAWSLNPTGTDAALPRGVASLINCKTLDPDVNGKKYIGGFGEDATGGGYLLTAFLTNVALFAADWVTPFTGAVSGATWTPGVWSPTRTNFYAMTGTVVIPNEPAYQRRRKRGVGI